MSVIIILQDSVPAVML